MMFIQILSQIIKSNDIFYQVSYIVTNFKSYNNNKCKTKQKTEDIHQKLINIWFYNKNKQIQYSHNMGNIQQHPQNLQQKGPKKPTPQKHILQIRDRQIILDYANKIKLVIGDIMSFPSGGFQGLHLWGSNITLARYILTNKQIFANKSVIQLLSGTGIAAITLKKYANPAKITATDKKQQVVENILKNYEKNQIKTGMVTACISWSQYKDYKAKFDLVIGADLLFKGSPVELLLAVLNKLLFVGGKALIIVPYRKGDDSTALFVSKIDSQVFQLKKQKLTDEIYMDSPLLNQVLGYQQYKEISQSYFLLYTLQKLKEKNIQPTSTLVQQQKQYSPTYKPAKQQSMLKQKSKQPQPLPQIEIKIKNQILDEPNKTQKQIQEHMTKQLSIVKIKKNQDQPQYIRGKKKTITQIIAASEQTKSNKQQNKNQQEIKQIQLVNKQHQLFNQPAKKIQSDRRSVDSSNKQKLQIEVDGQNNIRERNKSNPN